MLVQPSYYEFCRATTMVMPGLPEPVLVLFSCAGGLTPSMQSGNSVRSVTLGDGRRAKSRENAVANDRLQELAHYVIWRSDPAQLGATKLAKICWYSDLESHRSLGQAISRATHYKRLSHGPVPKNFHRAIDDLERSGRIAISTQNYYGRPKTMYMALVSPKIGVFTSDEVAIIDHIAEAICDKHTATSISRLSHDGLWEEIENGADIPVAAAAVIPGEITAEDLEWAAGVVDANRSTT